MPEETHTNTTPEGNNTGSDNNYPQANSKDDGFSDSMKFHSSNTANPNPSVHQDQSRPVNPTAHHGQTFSEFNQSRGESALPSVLFWLSFAVTLLATGFFWLSDYSNVKAIYEKENEKNSIVSQLNSENNKKVEEVAINFQSAFSQLSALVASGISKADFLTELFTHTTKDVKITSISLSDEGELGIDGATASYRQVADLMLGLKGDSKLSDVSLKNVGVSTEEGVPANQKIVFSMTAKVNFGTGAETAGNMTGESTSAATTPNDTTPTTQEANTTAP